MVSVKLAMTRVSGSSARYSMNSAVVVTASLPVETTWLKPNRRQSVRSPMAMEPLCVTMATVAGELLGRQQVGRVEARAVVRAENAHAVGAAYRHAGAARGRLKLVLTPPACLARFGEAAVQHHRGAVAAGRGKLERLGHQPVVDAEDDGVDAFGDVIEARITPFSEHCLVPGVDGVDRALVSHLVQHLQDAPPRPAVLAGAVDRDGFRLEEPLKWHGPASCASPRRSPCQSAPA